MSDNFKVATEQMEGSAKKASKSIIDSFSGIGAALASMGIGMGAQELFNISMEKASSGAALKNLFGDKGQAFMDEYIKYTSKSSTSDFELNKMFRGLIQMPNMQSGNVQGMLNAADALSSTGNAYDSNKFHIALMDFLSTGDALKLKDDVGKQDMKFLQSQWNSAKEKGDPTILQHALEDMAKKRGRMNEKGEGLATTTEGPLGAYNKAMAMIDNIVLAATQTFDLIMQYIVGPIVGGFNYLNSLTGGWVSKLTGGGLLIAGLGAGIGLLVAGALKLKDIFGAVGKRFDIFKKGYKVDVECDTGKCDVAGGVGTAKASKKDKAGKKGSKIKGGKLGGTSRSLGVISRVAGSARSSIMGLSAAVGLLTVAETAAAIAGSAMSLPIVAGAAVAGVAIYALTSGMRSNANTMSKYNKAMKEGEDRIKALRKSAEDYKNKANELTAEKGKLIAAGKDVTKVEAGIKSALDKSAQAARDAAAAEEALKAARAKKEEIQTRSTILETTYADGIKKTLKESGKFNKEQLKTLDAHNQSLKDGTALLEHGTSEKERIYKEGGKFIEDVMGGKHPDSDVWGKDINALNEYTTGMDSLAKLEEKYMQAESWPEKIQIGLEQLVTVGQIEWIKWVKKKQQEWADTVKSWTDAWNNFTKTLGKGYAWIKGAWNNTMNWLKARWDEYIQPIIDGWNNFTKTLGKGYAWIKGAWNNTMNWLKARWDEYIQPIIDGVHNMDFEFHKAFDNILAAAKPVLDALKTIKDTLYGQSPGILPGFRKMGRDIPQNIGTVLPSVNSFKNSLKSSLVSTEALRRGLPDLGFSSSYSGSDPNYTGGIVTNNSSSVTRVDNSNHHHHYGPVTINAKDMSRHELKSLMIEIFENAR